jgi:hypothetical protein
VNDKIEVSWTPPSSNFESIDAYRVLVKSSALSPTFEEEAVNCDASTPEVMAFTRCRIPVLVLRGAQYSLTAGTVVVALVQAHNARGWGPLSAENTAGAIITTVPEKMAAPTRDSAVTTPAQIKADWTALVAPQDGHSAVLSYNLEWDAGSNGASWSELVGATTNYLSLDHPVSLGVTGGISY